MKQLSSVSIKCPCIDQVLVYQSSTCVYQSSTQLCTDHVLTIVLTKKFSSVLINYSHISPSSTHVCPSCISIKYSHGYRSSTHTFQSCVSIEYSLVLIKNSYLYQRSNSHLCQENHRFKVINIPRINSS